MANRLASAMSPYLRQHADNPVDWYEWGEEAFTAARERDVPIFLSVGYAACHWCHVMAHETFEDPRLAGLINEAFVAVKVDREERPDVDSIYMAATQAMTGRGGWPMTVFLTPEQEPFWAGTYFPPTSRGGMPGFDDVVAAISQAWRERRDDVGAQVAQLTDAVTAQTAQRLDNEVDAEALLDDAVAALRRDFDAHAGGFGGAPKFPPTLALNALFDAPHGAELIEPTLAAMAAGGIHDQLAGGFARYSVDRHWVVPHFEKMLYDNALLLGCYARAAVRWPDAGFAEVASRIVAWLDAELVTETGGYASSLDADSADPVTGQVVEGAFYVWTPAQLVEALGESDGTWAAKLFDVTEAGTFEHGASTLQLRDRQRALAEPERYVAVCQRLLRARAERPRPGRDDKIVTAWNAMLITSLATAAMLINEPGWLDKAALLAETLWSKHWIEGRLRRSSLGDQVGGHAGVLEDYGTLAHAFLTLACATGDAGWLARADDLIEVAQAQFVDDGKYFDTAADAEQLWLRPAETSDNVTPSGRSAILAALELRARIEPGKPAPAEGYDVVTLTRAPRFAGGDLARLIADSAAADGGGPVEVAIVGGSGSAREELTRVAWRHAPGGSAIVTGAPDELGWALLENRPVGDDGPLAYVCRDFTCARPVASPDELQQLLTP